MYLVFWFVFEFYKALAAKKAVRDINSEALIAMTLGVEGSLALTGRGRV